MHNQRRHRRTVSVFARLVFRRKPIRVVNHQATPQRSVVRQRQAVEDRRHWFASWERASRRRLGGTVAEGHDRRLTLWSLVLDLPQSQESGSWPRGECGNRATHLGCGDFEQGTVIVDLRDRGLAYALATGSSDNGL